MTPTLMVIALLFTFVNGIVVGHAIAGYRRLRPLRKIAKGMAPGATMPPRKWWMFPAVIEDDGTVSPPRSDEKFEWDQRLFDPDYLQQEIHRGVREANLGEIEEAEPRVLVEGE